MKPSDAGSRSVAHPRYVHPPALAKPRGYSNGVAYGPPGASVLFLAGQIAWDAAGQHLAARKQIGERYRRRMGRHFPAMTLVEVRALLEPGALVEIEGIAWV